MARAVGIHLILATQRPRGRHHGFDQGELPCPHLVPCASKVDSRTFSIRTVRNRCLEGRHAVSAAGSARLHRIHGPLVTEDEITSYAISGASSAGKISEELLEAPKDENGRRRRGKCDPRAAKTWTTLSTRMRSAWFATRAGFHFHAAAAGCASLWRAARLIDLMEKDGIVGPPDARSRARSSKPELDEGIRRFRTLIAHVFTE